MESINWIALVITIVFCGLMIALFIKGKKAKAAGYKQKKKTGVDREQNSLSS